MFVSYGELRKNNQVLDLFYILKVQYSLKDKNINLSSKTNFIFNRLVYNNLINLR